MQVEVVVEVGQRGHLVVVLIAEVPAESLVLCDLSIVLIRRDRL